MKLSEKVYNLCRKIPHGKVSTYKILAEKLNSKAYRAVGQALKNNPSPETIPCFKIVKSNGDIGGYCGPDQDNTKKKIKKLKEEGIEVKKGKIDLNKYLFRFK